MFEKKDTIYEEITLAPIASFYCANGNMQLEFSFFFQITGITKAGVEFTTRRKIFTKKIAGRR